MSIKSKMVTYGEECFLEVWSLGRSRIFKGRGFVFTLDSNHRLGHFIKPIYGFSEAKVYDRLYKKMEEIKEASQDEED